jgi:N6-L-threonylcarbamoyladenine synthase
LSIIILGIESSCDDTAAAVIRDGIILSNILADQKIHAKFGGVVPELASRAHQQNIIPVIDHALQLANISKKQLNAIAYTQGPGLLGSLLVGSSFAKAFALALDIPLIAVHHLQAHVFANFIRDKNEISAVPPFPFLCLLVSGGHTQIIIVKNQTEFEIIGQSIDDAAGEAFDKAAKILGLPYPGGPIVAKLAEEKITAPFTLPRPMINSKNYDFSFSGLKTAVLYKLKELPAESRKLKAEFCYEFQQAVIDVLVSKTIRAAKEYKIKTIILGGGVAANEELRKQLGEAVKKNVPRCALLVPRHEFTGDNAAMIALVAYFRKNQFTNPENLKANGNLKLE